MEKQRDRNICPAATPRENPRPRTTERNPPPSSPRENPMKDTCTSGVVEFGPETLRVLLEVQADLKRIADHFDPQPADVVGTPYLADKLGCTSTWVAQMVRSGEIPRGCLVPGSGNGRQWKFYRQRIEEWMASK
jgi:hypothetical protein